MPNYRADSCNAKGKPRASQILRAKARIRYLRRVTRDTRACLICLCAAWLCLIIACSDRDKPVATVLTENEANEIYSVLRENGLSYVDKKEISKEESKQWSLTVNDGDYDYALQILNYHGLPRLEDKVSQGVMPDPAGEQDQRIRERQREIEKHLRGNIPGIVRVSVIISPPIDNLPQSDSARASVIIFHKDPGAPFTVDEIKQMVVNSFPNLKIETVDVKLKHQPPPSPPRRDIKTDQRDKMIFAGGIILTLALIALLALLLQKSRRQRLQLATRREVNAQEAEQNDKVFDPEVNTEQLSGTSAGQ